MEPLHAFNSSFARRQVVGRRQVVESTDSESNFSYDDYDDDLFEDDDSGESRDATVKKADEENLDHVRYQQLFEAIQENQWEGVEDFLNKDPEALTAHINLYKEETILHIITRTINAPIWLVEKLASMVGPESLERLTDWSGRTAVFCAAANGNTKAVEALVRLNRDLPNIKDSKGLLPIHEAAMFGHKETVQYLLPVTRLHKKAVTLLEHLINSGLYGIAVDLLNRYPTLARERNKDRRRVLVLLANKPTAFESGNRLGYWKRLIYHWIPLQEENMTCHVSGDGDMENPVQRSKKSTQSTHFRFLRPISAAFVTMSQKLHIILWNALLQLAPSIKCIRDMKLVHLQTLKIVRMMCHEGVIWSHKEASESLSVPLFTATRLGICELVNEILKAYFYSYTFREFNMHGIFHLAVQHHQAKVFSLIMSKTNLLLQDQNVANMPATPDNILHLAARMKPLNHTPPMPLMPDIRSSQVSGVAAALQIQSDLRWFKVVESYVQPSVRGQRNFANKTPREMFTEHHKILFRQGAKWMKTTASRCTILSAFIMILALVATFITPGGSMYTERMPLLLHEVAWNVFAMSNALALFTSSTCLLMFLSILTVHYSEEDFLESLPKRLIIGLIALFISIASMMVAVGGTVCKFLYHGWNWGIIPISLLSCLPVALFAMWQFPVLFEIFSSTYGPCGMRPRKKGPKNL